MLQDQGVDRMNVDRMKSAVSGAGWYPTGVAQLLGYWDGQVWSLDTRVDPDVSAEGIPPWLSLLKSLWLWCAVAGLVGAFIIGVVGQGTELVNEIATAMASLAVLVGFGGYVLSHWEGTMPGLASRTLVGLVLGVVAAGLAIGLHALASSFSAEFDTVLVGAIEESSKVVGLLVLWRLVPHFRAPGAGATIALVAASSFAFIEATLYATGIAIGPGSGSGSFVNRSLVELLHPILTVGVVAISWVAAHRKGRLLTLPLFAAFATAVVIHTVSDLGVLAAGNAVFLGQVVSYLIMILAFAYFLKPAVREFVSPWHVSRVTPGWHMRQARKNVT